MEFCFEYMEWAFGIFLIVWEIWWLGNEGFQWHFQTKTPRFPLTIVVKAGDIAHTTCDVQIKTVDFMWQNSATNVRAAKKSENTRLKKSGSNLHSMYVIEVKGVTPLAAMENHILEALHEAAKLGCTSLALPALGSGGAGVTSVKGALKRFQSENYSNIHYVEIYVEPDELPTYNMEMICSMREHCKEMKEKKETWRNLMPEIEVDCSEIRTLLLKRHDAVLRVASGYDFNDSISSALLFTGGYEVKVNCENHVVRCGRTYRITRANRPLDCKFIIHVKLPSNLTEQLACYKEVLNVTHECNAKTMLFMLNATDNNTTQQFLRQVRVLHRAILHFFKTRDSTFKRVTFTSNEVGSQILAKTMLQIRNIARFCEDYDYDVDPFDSTISVAQEVICFIKEKSNAGGLEILQEKIKEFAVVELVKQSYDLTFRFNPAYQQADSGIRNQSTFETRCTRCLEEFLCRFDSHMLITTHPNAAYFHRQLSVQTNSDEGMIWFFPNEISPGFQIYVRASFAFLHIAGFKNDIHTVSQLVKNVQHNTFFKDLIEVEGPVYCALCDCGILKNITSEHSEVQFSHYGTIESGIINLKGTRMALLAAKLAIERARQKMTRKKIPSSQLWVKFLVASNKTTASHGLLKAKIREELGINNVNASLQVKPNEAWIYFQEKNQFERAINVIQSAINHYTLALERGINKFLKTQEWKTFCETICKSTTVEVFVCKNYLTVVGLRHGVATAFKKIRKKLNENVVVETSLKAENVKIDYVRKFMQAQVQSTLVQLEVSYSTLEPNSSIKIKGKRKDVPQGVLWLKKKLNDIHHKSFKMKDWYPCSYMQREIIQNKIWKHADNSKCITHDLSHKYSINFGDVQIKVSLQDITKCNCEAIVHTTNQELAFKKSGVAASILKKGGLSLQSEISECSKRIGKLPVGSAVTTNAGDLGLKKIIHAVGPNWRVKSSSHEADLQNCVLSCLNEAVKYSITSLALPAISCEDNCGQENVCLPVIVHTIADFIKGNEKSGIKKIMLVESSNVDVVSKFRNLLQKLKWMENVQSSIMPSNGTAMLHKAPQPSHTTKIKKRPIDICIEQGNIALTYCDGLVNSTSNFSLTGEIGRALISHGGVEIASALQYKQLVAETIHCQVTKAGDLYCQCILHVDTPQDPTELPNVLQEIWQLAEDLKLESLAIPAIGTGKIGLCAEEVSKSIHLSIKKFECSKQQHLTNVSIYVFQQTMVPIFWQELLTPQSASFAHPVEGQCQKLCPVNNLEIISLPESVEVTVCVKAPQSTDEVWNDVVNDLNSEEYEIEVSLTPQNVSKSLQIATVERNILFKIMATHCVKIYVVKGHENSVKNACKELESILQDLQNALMCSEFVEWRYFDMVSVEFRKFPLVINHKLENNYKTNSSIPVYFELHYGGVAIPYCVSTTEFTGTRLDSQAEVQVQRLLKDAEQGLPANWDGMGKRPMKLVTLAKNTAEYRGVLAKFRASMNCQSVQLERIQNPALYKQFQVQKNKVKKRLEKQKLPIIRELFHGTDKETAQKICQNGFDRSYAGKNATYFGEGVYFAKDAQFSSQRKYAVPDERGHKRMFLADVITGQYCGGNNSMKAAPLQVDHTPYDSTVDSVGNPKIFVVYKDASVYPLYLLTYKQ